MAYSIHNTSSYVPVTPTLSQQAICADDLLRIRNELRTSYKQEATSVEDNNRPEYKFTSDGVLFSAWFNDSYHIVVLVPTKHAWGGSTDKLTMEIDDTGKIVRMKECGQDVKFLGQKYIKRLQDLYRELTGKPSAPSVDPSRIYFPYSGASIQEMITYAQKYDYTPYKPHTSANKWIYVQPSEKNPEITQLCLQTPIKSFNETRLVCIIEMQNEKVVGLIWKEQRVEELPADIIEQYFVAPYKDMLSKLPAPAPIQILNPYQTHAVIQQVQQQAPIAHAGESRQPEADVAATAVFPMSTWVELCARVHQYQTSNHTAQVTITIQGVTYTFKLMEPAIGSAQRAFYLTRSAHQGGKAQVLLTGTVGEYGFTPQYMNGAQGHACIVLADDNGIQCTAALRTLIQSLGIEMKKIAP